MKCPKCKEGMMRQQGFDSCNWRCELCGYKQYVPKPSKPNGHAATQKLHNLQADFNSSASDCSQALRDAHRAANRHAEICQKQRQAEARAKKAAKQAKKAAKKKSGGGIINTIFVIIVILWLLSKFA